MDEIYAIVIRGRYIASTAPSNLHAVFRRQILRLWEDWMERLLRAKLH